jgi:hypothetical protein
MNAHDVPPGVQAAYRLRDAAAILGGLDARTLLRWASAGYITSFQPALARGLRGGQYWIPSTEIARLAGMLQVEADWFADA